MVLIPDSVFKHIFSFSREASNLARTSRINSDIYRDHLNDLMIKLNETKKEGRSSLVLPRFWNIPALWKYMGESKKNIFIEGLKHGVFIEELYNPKWIFDAILISTEYGYDDITIKLLPKLIPTIFEHTFRFSRLLENAAFHNNVGLIDMIMKHERNLTCAHGDESPWIRDYQWWNSIVHGAARGGHMDLIKVGIHKFFSSVSDLIMEAAAESGSIEIIDFFLNRIHVNKIVSGQVYAEMLEGAANSGKMEIVDRVISKILSMGGSLNYRAGLDGAVSSKNSELIKLFALKLGPRVQMAWLHSTEDDEIINLFISLQTRTINSRYTVYGVVCTGTTKWVNYFLGESPSDELLIGSINNAVRSGHFDLARNLFERVKDKSADLIRLMMKCDFDYVN
jgi:hypothetical protein